MLPPNKPFAALYQSLREKEGRQYSDEELRCLPTIDKYHPHSREWSVRKKSSQKLWQYLKKKRQALRILEVGCGNGWFAHLLSQLPDSLVFACDPSTEEIDQAQRVFFESKNLKFEVAEFGPDVFSGQTYDCIVFAASVQYFANLSALLKTAFGLLNDGGEIHILDSPFYKEADLERSQKNSEHHFDYLGVPDMKHFYFRHTLAQLQSFLHTTLYQPNPIFLKLGWQTRPFPWIRLRKTG